jgi:hypothetical protein
LVIVAPLSAQENAPAASPEMAKLAKALAGDWDTTETMVRNEFFPNGGSRHGRAHVTLTAGGTTLMDEVHSDGSAGRLDGIVIIWWEKAAGVYRFFVCFNDVESACKVRGTAHWEGDTFVNDYEEVINGKTIKFRDSFVDITPTSHKLIAAMDTGNGAMKTLITTTSTRR